MNEAAKQDAGGGGAAGGDLLGRVSRLPWDQIGFLTSGAIMYFLIHQWAEEEAYIGTIDIVPRPEAFDRDEIVAMSFQKIGKYKQIDEEAYRWAVRYMDRILLMEKQLLRKEIQPKTGDIVAVRTNMARVMNRLLWLRTQCTDPKAFCILRRESLQIEDRLKHHHRVIQSLCRELR